MSNRTPGGSQTGEGRSARLLGHPPSVLAAHGFCWLICIGLEYKDAVRVHDEAMAALAQQSVAPKESSALDPMRAVWSSLHKVVRNRRRWDWRRFLHRLVDVPVKATMAAAPIAVGVGGFTGLLVQSTASGIVAGLLAGLLTLVVRSIRRIRRSVRYESDEIYKQHMVEPSARWLTAPNMITALRFPGAVSVLVLASRSHLTAAAAVFALLIATDLLDGVIARLLDQQTRLGRQIDPVADRVAIVLASSALVLYANSDLPGLLAVGLGVLAVRDLLLLGGGLIALLEESKLPPHNLSGKAASVAAMAGVQSSFLVALATPAPHGLYVLSLGLVGASAALGFISLGKYYREMQIVGHTPVPTERVVGPAEYDPYTHGGVMSLLDYNPLDVSLAEVFGELLLRSEQRLDHLDPLELVREEIQIVAALVARQTPSHARLHEYLETLESLEEAIILMRPEDPR